MTQNQPPRSLLAEALEYISRGHQPHVIPTKNKLSHVLENPARALLGNAANWTRHLSDRSANLMRITCFLSGRSSFRVRDSDIFISSYPRSGTTLTTWIVYLLVERTHLLDQEISSMRHISDAVPWFERSLALGHKTVADFERLANPRIFKSHLPKKWLPTGARYLYVYRDGEDVLMSYYHFYCDYLGFEGDLHDFYEHFVSGRKLQYGSWSTHVESWRQHQHDPDTLMLRYEDLVQRRRDTIESIADFLNISIDSAQREKIINLSSFESMKALESKFDHATSILLESAIHPGRFIRQGAQGSSNQALSREQKQKLEQAFRSNHLQKMKLGDFLR